MMRRARGLAIGVVVLSLCASLAGQEAASALEKAAIDRARKALVSDFDKRLPHVNLEYFLQSEAGKGARLEWESNDCGEQTGSPEADRGRDFPICAQATVQLPDGRQLEVMVAVGSVARGVSGKPAVWSIELRGADGRYSSIRRLGDVPAALHKGRNPEHPNIERPRRQG